MLKVHIKTFGCAMNFYDSEVAEGILQAAGYDVTSENGYSKVCGPEKYMEDDFTSEKRGLRIRDDDGRADIFLINTCSVREHAEDRVYGRIGLLGKAKKSNPDLIIGIMGCMAEEHREKLFKRFPQLDFMVGTRNIKDLPTLIDEVFIQRKQTAKIRQEGMSIEYTNKIKRHGKFHGWLPIMTGCNKNCTFCIVPLTRGREVSMPYRDVYHEACRMVETGVKWITLLGQNVNSYDGNNSACFYSVVGASGSRDNVLDSCQNAADKRNAPTLFPALLEMLCGINGLERISFTTSHPQDATEDLFKVIERNQKISRRFHLPLQSGSDKILKRMKRLHTYDEYYARISRLRELVPDISITTDIIVGFPGETIEDHTATVSALKNVRFDGAYIYKYSPRGRTPAAKMKDDVPLPLKEKRLLELLDLQKNISMGNNNLYLGKIWQVFVEARSKKSRGQMIGRNNQEKKVAFDCNANMLGTFCNVKFESLRHETFAGQMV